jgi:hypothetical protein
LKVAIINDSHLGKGNDSLAHDSYFQRFYDKILFPELYSRKIKVIWHLGDLYDRRRFVNFDILSRSRDYFVQPISDFYVKMVIGNHDIYHSETLSLNGPSLLMNGMPNFYILTEPYENDEALFIPWITKENHDRCMKAIEKSSSRICCGHFDLQGFEMDGGQIQKHGLDPKVLEKFELVMSGHFHTKSERGAIKYLGAQYQMTWADCDVKKGFHILDTDTLDLEFIENPFTLYKKFHYDDVNNQDAIEELLNSKAEAFHKHYVKIIIEKRTNHAMFDAVHKILSGAGVHDLSVIDKVPDFVIRDSALQTIGEETGELHESISLEDTNKIIQSYAESAKYPAHINRDRIKSELNDLYRDASQMMAQT